MAESAEFIKKSEVLDERPETCKGCVHRNICKYVDDVKRFEKMLWSLIDSHTEDIHYLSIDVNCQYKIAGING